MKNAKLIFGPNATLLKRKPARRKTTSVVTNYIETHRKSSSRVRN